MIKVARFSTIFQASRCFSAAAETGFFLKHGLLWDSFDRTITSALNQPRSNEPSAIRPALHSCCTSCWRHLYQSAQAKLCRGNKWSPNLSGSTMAQWHGLFIQAALPRTWQSEMRSGRTIWWLFKTSAHKWYLPLQCHFISQSKFHGQAGCQWGISIFSRDGPAKDSGRSQKVQGVRQGQ